MQSGENNSDDSTHAYYDQQQPPSIAYSSTETSVGKYASEVKTVMGDEQVASQVSKVNYFSSFDPSWSKDLL